MRQIQNVFRKRGPPPSTSTESEVIAEAKRRDSDLENMRQLFVTLKKIGGDVYSALRGCVVLDQLHESGFTISDSEEVLGLRSGRPVGVVDTATELLKLEKVTKKTVRVWSPLDLTMWTRSISCRTGRLSRYIIKLLVMSP